MVTERLQALVDRNVAGSPRARALLEELEGRSLRVVARYTPWQLTLSAAAGRLLLSRAAEREVDATLSGTPFALLSMTREDPQEVIRRGDVQIEGDGQVAGIFQELALLLRPDLEAELAQVIGEVPAFGVGSLLRRALDYGRGAARTGAQNVGEYLAHERRELVPRAEARHFLEEVDALRESVDRVAARVARLESGHTE
jgi:ubiquinone biosynthesis protein UbiJ